MPIVGNVYLLNKGVARMFHSGKLAGCVVSDELLASGEHYAAGPDKGKKFFQELAAKQLAVFKGLGFAAGYLGGMSKAETFGQIIDLAESYAPDDWRQFIKEIQFSQPDEFFLFEHDPQTGLSEPTRINPRVSQVAGPAAALETGDAQLPAVAAGARAWRLRATGGFTGCLGGCLPVWTKSRACWAALAYGVERQSKRLLYGCQECGDCSLPDCAYLCPRHACSKGSRERALRRLGRGALRVGRQGLLLGPRLRAAEDLRRVGADARPARRHLQPPTKKHLVLGQFLPGSRPSRTQGGRRKDARMEDDTIAMHH